MSLYLAFTLSNEDKQKLSLLLLEFKRKTNLLTECEDTTALHITLLKIDNDEIYPVIKAMKIWKNKYQCKSFKIMVDGVYSFPNVYWFGINNSLPLYRIHSEFCKILNFLSIPYDNHFKSYVPHITVAFMNMNDENDDDQSDNIKFDPVEININNIVLWGMDTKVGKAHVSSTLFRIDF